MSRTAEEDAREVLRWVGNNLRVQPCGKWMAWWQGGALGLNPPVGIAVKIPCSRETAPVVARALLEDWYPGRFRFEGGEVADG